MKKHKILLLICSSLMAVFLHSPPAAAINEVCTAKGAAETQSSTTQILCRAFQEECRSIALYGAYIRKFGDTRPLSGISSAKRAHGAVLKSLLLKYGWQIPENTLPKDIVVPDTLLEAYRSGLEREKETIEMYNTFLRYELPENIKTIFSVLRTSAANHQKAFERAIARYEKNRI
jgi:hypothetical protein